MSNTTIKAALTDLPLTPEPDLQKAADRHFAPDYRQRTDGERPIAASSSRTSPTCARPWPRAVSRSTRD
ncbi:hypothetical protein [Embleya scabrispora]|uniref:hypothetical protein n=1 Tax=Embleya scabrispora TaxID=159449 RepID=UPI001912D7EF|nr:hypothetical protein [Embleya scabrispora]